MLAALAVVRSASTQIGYDRSRNGNQACTLRPSNRLGRRAVHARAATAARLSVRPAGPALPKRGTDSPGERRYGAPHRLLQRLASCGLVRVDAVGRQKFYQANPAAPIHNELVALVRKTIGLREPLREALMPLASDIDLAFVYGSVASGEDGAGSDIDLMVVAHTLDYATLFDALQTAEQALDRPVNPSIISPADWASKRRQKDGFVARVAMRPRLLVIGEDEDGHRTA